MSKKTDPTLRDLLYTWLKTELKRFPIKEEKDKLIIDVLQGKQKCFEVMLAKDYLLLKGIGSLEEYYTIKDDKIVGGKWSQNAEILAADPEFFPKLAYCMTWAAKIITMGHFQPRMFDRLIQDE